MAYPTHPIRTGEYAAFPNPTGQMTDAQIDAQIRSINATEIKILTDTFVRKISNDHAHLQDPIRENIAEAFSTPGSFVKHGIHLQITDYNAYGYPIDRKAVNLTVKVRNILDGCRIDFRLDADATRQQSTLVFRLTVIKDGKQVYNEKASLRTLIHSSYLNFSSYSNVYRPPEIS